MMTQLKGALWPTLETTVRGIEIGRAGWGSPSALAALQGLDVPAIWLCNQETGGLPAVVQRTLVTHGPVDAITLDGAAVGVHYPTASGDVKTMYIGTRQMKRGGRVLIIDDFMRGGSTASGMLLMAKQFDAEVAGIGVFIAYDEPKEKAVPEYRSLLTLRHDAGGEQRLTVTPEDAR